MSAPCWQCQIDCPSCSQRHVVVWCSLVPPWQMHKPLAFTCPTDQSRVAVVRAATWSQPPTQGDDAIALEVWDAMD